MQTKLYTGKQVSEIDALAITNYGVSGLALMQKAGRLAFGHIQSRYMEKQSILVVCGSGNNGGDGYVIAMEALNAGWQVMVIEVSASKTKDAISAQQSYLNNKYFNDSGSIISADIFLAMPISALSNIDVVVDAMLGVGLSSAPKGVMAEVINRVNELSRPIVAIDVPTGIDSDTGQVYQPHCRAELTITFIANKIGLLTGAAVNAVGNLQLESLDIDNVIVNQVGCCAHFILPPRFEKRLSDSHKGSYGSVLIAGGDNGMLGAILLSGKSALRCGSGKVHLLSTPEHLDLPTLYCAELMSAAYKNSPEDITALVAQASVIAIGPGLGLSEWSNSLFSALINQVIANKPMVVDADALTLLAQEPRFYNNWVLTPHPGEAARLLDCSGAEIQANRYAAATAICEKYGGVCVLKGAGTIVAKNESVNIDGSLDNNENIHVSLCNKGNAGMATAGMGDVLTGMIAAFIAQGMPIYQAAQAAVWLHADGADKLVEDSSPRSLIASDIINRLAQNLFLLEQDS